jgi:hypothetical protein
VVAVSCDCSMKYLDENESFPRHGGPSYTLKAKY